MNICHLKPNLTELPTKGRGHTIGRRIILVMLVGNKSALGEHLLLHIWVKASRCELCERARLTPVAIQDHAVLIHCKYTATFIVQKENF